MSFPAFVFSSQSQREDKQRIAALIISVSKILIIYYNLKTKIKKAVGMKNKRTTLMTTYLTFFVGTGV